MNWWPVIITFAGALLSAGGVLWASLSDANEKVKLAEERGRFETELRTKTDEQLRSQQQLVAKSDEISKLNQQIAALSAQSAAYVRGDGSFCFFEPSLFQKQHTTFLSLVNGGVNPLYDLRVRIVPNPQEAYAKGAMNFDAFEYMLKNEKTLIVGTLSPSPVPGKAIPAETVKWELPTDKDHLDFSVFFSARNAKYMQLLRYRKVNGRWYFAYRVTRDLLEAEGAVVKQFILPGYPTNPDGSVHW
ncbi:MAG: hypothetical protein J0M12_13790 [Deltaproteobacteria bacterium]|nr:hypothetical protein [Deltaproteobacteria bacterium]